MILKISFVLIFLGLQLCAALGDIITITNYSNWLTNANNERQTYPFLFTTAAYRNAAFNLVLQEANNVARELNLQDNLPITESNILGAYISPYGLSRFAGTVGNITTSNYTYYVSVDKKFSYLDKNEQEADQLKFSKEFIWPMNLLDTNAAYQQATQWLAAVSMDVNGLNKDCHRYIQVVGPKFQGTNMCFVPIYSVFWTRGQLGQGSVASVSFCAPTRTLLELHVEDSKYIHRKQLQFTNLDYLLLQTNSAIRTGQ